MKKSWREMYLLCIELNSETVQLYTLCTVLFSKCTRCKASNINTLDIILYTCTLLL